jgi:hypothetical protein
MRNILTTILVVTLLLLLPRESSLFGQQLNWQVIAAAGADGTSTNMKLSGTIGQTGTRTGTGGNLKLIGGFWQNFSTTTACTSCGDADGSGSVDISDAVYIIAYIFAGGLPPGACGTPTGLGDADGSGSVDISDAVYLISYIFGGGLHPHCP